MPVCFAVGRPCSWSASTHAMRALCRGAPGAPRRRARAPRSPGRWPRWAMEFPRRGRRRRCPFPALARPAGAAGRRPTGQEEDSTHAVARMASRPEPRSYIFPRLLQVGRRAAHSRPRLFGRARPRSVGEHLYWSRPPRQEPWLRKRNARTIKSGQRRERAAWPAIRRSAPTPAPAGADDAHLVVDRQEGERA